MKKLLLLLPLAALSSNANAITSEFLFDVLSSGPDIYVCNAGIRHIQPAGNVSDRQGNGTVTTDDPGENVLDKMIFRFAEVDIWDFSSTSGQTQQLRETGGSDWATATGFHYLYSNVLSAHKIDYHGVQERNKVLEYLQFELSSERFGTEYFIDVCYYMPQFGSDDSTSAYKAKAELTFSNLYQNNYRSLSALLVKGALYCDGVLKKETNWSSANVSAKSLWSDHNVGSEAPEKCVTRYFFKENTEDRRPNGKHGARVKVRTTITNMGDGSGNGNGNANGNGNGNANGNGNGSGYGNGNGGSGENGNGNSNNPDDDNNDNGIDGGPN